MEGFEDLLNSLQSKLDEVEASREKAERRFDRQERRTDRLEEEGGMFPGYNYKVRRKKEKEQRDKRMGRLDKKADKIRDQIARVGLGPKEVRQLNRKEKFEDLLNEARSKLNRKRAGKEKFDKRFERYDKMYKEKIKANPYFSQYAYTQLKENKKRKDERFSRQEPKLMDRIARLEDRQSKFLETLGE
tara:strand:+ start:673 stop:1236 length:564 start_codon:yes stop_codon:yes gene_type:complete